MNPLIKWLLILLLFYSCNHFKNNNLQNNSLLNFSKELVAKENAKIKIDANVHFKSWQIHIKEVNDTTYLTRKNYFKNSIIVYNWNTKKKIREYKLKSEGPNKVLKFDSAGFLELDKDKFLIANGYSQTYIVENAIFRVC